MKRGFTLIELLIVMAMIAIIAASFATSVTKARARAYAGRATQEIKEMTNAILAYEQYAPNRSLQTAVQSGWSDCSEGAMSMILGGVKGDNGEQVPVLFNGHVTAGFIRDPWGMPYQYRIEKTSTLEGGGGEETKKLKYWAAAALPNFNRLLDEEKR